MIDGWELELLQIVSDADIGFDQLWVQRDGDGLRWIVNCSDFFHWGTADGEGISGQDDVNLLRQCYVDLQVAEQYAEVYMFQLFCCRKRAMRPMRLWRKAEKMADDSPVTGLFDACGRERTPAEEG
jgi:hypothetical protein